MALAQNVFRTITNVVPSSPVGIYTAPVGYSGVVLLASATNIGAGTQTISFSHERSVAGVAVTTEVLKTCLLYTSPSPRDLSTSRMPSSA